MTMLEFLQLFDVLRCLTCQYAPWLMFLPGVLLMRWIGK